MKQQLFFASQRSAIPLLPPTARPFSQDLRRIAKIIDPPPFPTLHRYMLLIGRSHQLRLWLALLRRLVSPSRLKDLSPSSTEKTLSTAENYPDTKATDKAQHSENDKLL
jgi:hypothetical protein